MYFGLLKKYNFDHQHIFFLENNYFIELEMRKARDNPQGRAKLEQKRETATVKLTPQRPEQPQKPQKQPKRTLKHQT